MGKELADLMTLGFAEWMERDSRVDKPGQALGRRYLLGKLIELINKRQD